MRVAPSNFSAVVFTRVALMFCALWAAKASSEDVTYQDLLSAEHYVSWQGIEPDKWSSIWLIKRYISDRAFFQFFPPNSEIPDTSAVTLDMPSADLSRGNDQSLFHQLKSMLPDPHAELDYLDQIIYDIEVNVWDRPQHRHSDWFEAMFRQLQERYRRDSVPAECYFLFFDRVAELSKQSSITAADYKDSLSLKNECPGLVKHNFAMVAEVSQREVLDMIGLGKKVVFVDTREEEEFDEVRLPGAVLLRLRDVEKESVADFIDADLVVPYCVKDFRGFEVAKAIKALGVSNVATLSPNGLKGWISAGLPVVKGKDIGSGPASKELYRCAMEPSQCLQGDSHGS